MNHANDFKTHNADVFLVDKNRSNTEAIL
jgi:hypothetical protein